MICWYGDKDSPSLKAVYKISGFDYNINNSKKYVVDILAKWEEIGLNDKQIRNALQDILVVTKGVFKKYNRKTHRFNTFAKSSVENDKTDLRTDSNQSDGTRVLERTGADVSARKRNATEIDTRKSKDDTIYDSAIILSLLCHSERCPKGKMRSI